MSFQFDTGVLAPDPGRRRQVLDWLAAAVETVDPERLTAEALRDRGRGPAVIIAIGKAAPAMARGAASAIEVVGGLCVTDHAESIPDGLTLMIGDHPVPGDASNAAGAAVLQTAAETPSDVDLVALLSGGGSALCEVPRPGVSPEFIGLVNARLVSSGVPIEDANLVRSHLSAIKGGGVSKAARRPIDTLVISDVGAAGPEVVASGPTIRGRHDPVAALAVLERVSIEVPDQVADAIRAEFPPVAPSDVAVLADGHDAAGAIAAAAPSPARIASGWLEGDAGTCLERFLASAGSGVTVAAGEPALEVVGPGSGGRCTHAALLAASHIRPEDIFCAFATDGVDGNSGASGAIVDGSTIVRGGDPTRALGRYDSAAYLRATSDLLLCPPTGTNVSDIWVLWRPATGPP